MRYNIPEPALEPTVVKPDCVCDECGEELYGNQLVVHFGGEVMCESCFRDEIDRLPIATLAAELGHRTYTADEMREELKI